MRPLPHGHPRAPAVTQGQGQEQGQGQGQQHVRVDRDGLQPGLHQLQRPGPSLGLEGPGAMHATPAGFAYPWPMPITVAQGPAPGRLQEPDKAAGPGFAGAAPMMHPMHPTGEPPLKNTVHQLAGRPAATAALDDASASIAAGIARATADSPEGLGPRAPPSLSEPRLGGGQPVSETDDRATAGTSASAGAGATTASTPAAHAAALHPSINQNQAAVVAGGAFMTHPMTHPMTQSMPQYMPRSITVGPHQGYDSAGLAPGTAPTAYRAEQPFEWSQVRAEVPMFREFGLAGTVAASQHLMNAGFTAQPQHRHGTVTAQPQHSHSTLLMNAGFASSGLGQAVGPNAQRPPSETPAHLNLNLASKQLRGGGGLDPSRSATPSGPSPHGPHRGQPPLPAQQKQPDRHGVPAGDAAPCAVFDPISNTVTVTAGFTTFATLRASVPELSAVTVAELIMINGHAIGADGMHELDIGTVLRLPHPPSRPRGWPGAPPPPPVPEWITTYTIQDRLSIAQVHTAVPELQNFSLADLVACNMRLRTRIQLGGIHDWQNHPLDPGTVLQIPGTATKAHFFQVNAAWPRTLVDIIVTTPAFKGYSLDQVCDANAVVLWNLKLSHGIDWAGALPDGTILAVPREAPAAVAAAEADDDDALTPAETETLGKIAGRSKTWTFGDICRLVKAMKAHPDLHPSGAFKDWDAIFRTSGITAKTKVQAIKFHSNFKQARGPILEYLRQTSGGSVPGDGRERDGEGLIAEREGGGNGSLSDVEIDSDDDDDGDDAAPAERPATDLSAELAALAHWELRGINGVARSEKSWSLDQIATYYTCCKLHGVGSVDLMHQHLRGTKSREQIRRYSSDWSTKAGTILQYVESYRPGGLRSAKGTHATSLANCEKIGGFAFAEFAKSVQEEPVKMALDEDRSALTESEQLGLLAISANAKTWNHKQLTCYYRGLKHHGKKFPGNFAAVAQVIAQEIPGKSSSDVLKYFHNWNRSKPPMEEWLQNFKATQKQASSVSTGTKRVQNAADPVPAAGPVGPLNMAELSPSERAGLEDIAQRSSKWSLLDIVIFYTVSAIPTPHRVH